MLALLPIGFQCLNEIIVVLEEGFFIVPVGNASILLSPVRLSMPRVFDRRVDVFRIRECTSTASCSMSYDEVHSVNADRSARGIAVPRIARATIHRRLCRIPPSDFADRFFDRTASAANRRCPGVRVRVGSHSTSAVRSYRDAR